MAFFGDHYNTDVNASAMAKTTLAQKWHSFAVIEELAQVDPRLRENLPADHIDTSRLWGPSYFYEEQEGQRVKSLLVGEVCRVARYAVPYMRSISLLMP